MENTEAAKKERVEKLNKEIEILTRESDEVLGEVIKCRKLYPKSIADMKQTENRERFARCMTAPLKSSRIPEKIDVERIKNDITRKVDKTQNLLELKKTLEANIERMKKEKAALDQQVQNLLEAVTSSRYAPIDALPEDFVF